MSGNLDTREFSIKDYDAAIGIWRRVEGLEIAEGDDREGIAQFLTRNPGLSRVAIDGAAVVGGQASAGRMPQWLAQRWSETRYYHGSRR